MQCTRIYVFINHNIFIIHYLVIIYFITINICSEHIRMESRQIFFKCDLADIIFAFYT